MQSVAEKAVAAHLRYMDGKWGRRLPNYDANKRNPNKTNRIDPIDGYLQAALIAFEPKDGAHQSDGRG